MRFRALCAFAATACVVACVQAQRSNYRDVWTEEGIVRGTVGADYVSYLGVPYAAPPIGENRFKDPIPHVSWEGIYEANRTVKCPYNGDGDEDCLVLNIFTPLEGKDSPVLVYIHGGSFIMGSGHTSGVEHLTKDNLTVVTINYRLGVLGFLCLGTKDAPGNAGLKDQVAALTWVQRNIASFGGDHKQVTIYGVSAGGASVEFHVLSEMSKGLFKRAIVESGSVTSVWTTDPEPIVRAINFGKILGFPETNNLTKLVEYYKEIPADKLSLVNNDYYNNLTDGSFGFVACVERDDNNTKAFMTEPPYEVLSKEKYDKIPLMVFFTAFEGLFLRSEEYYILNYKERMEENFIDFIPGDLIFKSQDMKQEVSETVKQFYFGNDSISDSKIIEYLNYFGDYLIVHGLLNSVEVHSRDQNAVYLMEFSYKGQMGSYEEFYENITIAGHGDVLKHAILNKPIQNEGDRKTVERVAKLIANFVKFGNPTPNETELLPVTWPTYQPDKRYLHLDKDLQVLQLSQHLMMARMKFWDELYNKRRRPVKPVDPSPYVTSSGYSLRVSGVILLICSLFVTTPYQLSRYF